MRLISWTMCAVATTAILVAGSGCEKKQAAPEKGAPEKGTESNALSGTASAAAQPSADEVLLGVVGSLTGAQATFGISTRNGVQMAANEINAAGGIKGKKVAIRVYDNMGKPEESANVVTRLIAQDKVHLVLGEVASTNSLAMAPKAQEAKVPMITPSSTNPKVTAVGDYIFRVCFIDPFQGFVMAKFARENLKATNVAVLRDSKSDYSIGLSDVFTARFQEMGGKIIGSEAYAQGDTDFRAQLTALKKLKPEAIYIPGYYTDVGLIARQARELGMKAILLGGDGWESERLFELGGTAIEGSYYSNHYSVDDPSPRVQNFLAQYKEKFGGAPDALAALAYDATLVAADAIKRAPDLSGPAIRDAIAATKDFDGVTGKITLDANRNAIKPAVVLQVVGGKLKYVTTVSP